MSHVVIRQDTFDLRQQIVTDDDIHLGQGHGYHSDEEEHSMIEEDSEDDREEQYVDDDRSSSLSIPNESIDFDLVYSLHSFAATVEGQASVVKGDSLVLMDDSNSYWWLVRVLKTQEIGYIPAENIETPFERLARLNKHRNVDLASATQAEMQSGLQDSRERFMSSRNGSHHHSPSPTPGSDVHANRLAKTRSVSFNRNLHFSRYPPAVWHEEEEEEEEEDDDWDIGEYTQERSSFAGDPQSGSDVEIDDGMSWEDPMLDAARTHDAVIGAQAIIAEDQHRLEIQTQQQREVEAEQQEAERQRQQQLQRQQIEEQRRQQQQVIAQQQAAAVAASQQSAEIRLTESHERLAGQESSSSLASSSRSLDPAIASDTRKITVTPPVAQDSSPKTGPMLPSDVMRKQEEDRKRTREEIEALEQASVGRAPRTQADASPSLSPARQSTPSKLQKERPTPDDEGSGKKAKSGLFGGLFGRRKDKHKDKGSIGSISDTGHSDTLRQSEESSRSSSIQHEQRSGPSPGPGQVQPSGLQSAQSPTSIHAQQLRNRDKEQQALYQQALQQYLNRSPASPPEVQPNIGFQPAPSLAASASLTSAGSLSLPTEGRRARPGSLVLMSNGMEGQGPGVPELSVIRVFAGKKLQTEATFKTVLLNANTTAADLVRQAMQRFRLPAGEDANDYYLTVKQVEGSTAALKPEENPLIVFEALVETALELPKVKRSSVGSISSIASNLSMHPAIKKLPMNDFTDDSAVKLYLNRRADSGPNDSSVTDDADLTMVAESVTDGELGSPRGQTLTIPGSVATERFMSPSFRFALKLIIYPDDLPDDMIFDPVTEAIVFKNTLRDRPLAPSAGVSQAHRRKILIFPKNITVAEVIEIGLERFGISEGVVDGGDEVEDKMTKRRSASRVRYVLHLSSDSKERELSMSTKIIDAYPHPPSYKSAERRFSDNKRRSVDSMQILGNPEDVSPNDPVFVLRRATTYRASSGRHRVPAPLDEIALQKLHRESTSSTSSAAEELRQRHMSKQELIAAQREASRATQRAMLSVQANSVRGVDVLLTGNAMLRSARTDVDDRMRYSYVQPDGESVDVSDIIEEVMQVGTSPRQVDLLEGVLGHRAGLDEKLDRVLSKIKDGQSGAQVQSQTTIDSIASLYSGEEGDSESEDRSGAMTPPAAQLNARRTQSTSITSGPRVMSPVSSSRNTTPIAWDQRPRATPPVDPHMRNQSSASIMSDSTSGYRTAMTSPMISTSGLPRQTSTPKPPKPRPVLPRDDFGVSHMMSIIELAGLRGKSEPLPPLDTVDELLFGRQFDVESLHPLVREIYAPSFKQLEDMDNILDDLLQATFKV